MTEEGCGHFESLDMLLTLLIKHQMNECSFFTFLENFNESTFDKNQKDNRQRTLLHQAAVAGNIGVINGILKDTEINANQLDKDQCTPLCLAIREENYQAALILIEAGVDVNKGGGIFASPLHLAIVRLEISVIEALIHSKADLNKQDSDGNTPLHLVMNIYSKHQEKCAYIMELLVFNGAEVNKINVDKWSPVHTAIRKGQEDALVHLVGINR